MQRVLYGCETMCIFCFVLFLGGLDELVQGFGVFRDTGCQDIPPLMLLGHEASGAEPLQAAASFLQPLDVDPKPQTLNPRVRR